MDDKKNWIHIDEFNKLASWILGQAKPSIDWQEKFPANILYKIAKDYGSEVFIGIKGGIVKLSGMSTDDISKKEWQISTHKANSQWIPGDTFKEILEKKQVF